MRALEYVDLSLAGMVAALLLELATVRAVTRRRRARTAAARERFEELLAEVLVSEGPVPAQLELDRLQQDTLLDVGLAALLELRGRERERVAALLEAGGLVERAAATLGRGRVWARRHAADVLGLVASPGAAEPLRAALEDADPIVRVAAAHGLAQLDPERVAARAPEIADAAADRGAGAVAELALALGVRAPAALGPMYASARLTEARRIAVAAIGALRLQQHAPLLREALRDPDDELAARAARALGRIGDTGAADALLAVVRDENRAWFVRSVATTALGQLGDPAAVATLAAELEESDEWPRRRAAAEALAELGPDGEAALRAALAAPAEDVREQAQAALDR